MFDDTDFMCFFKHYSAYRCRWIYFEGRKSDLFSSIENRSFRKRRGKVWKDVWNRPKHFLSVHLAPFEKTRKIFSFYLWNSVIRFKNLGTFRRWRKLNSHRENLSQPLILYLKNKFIFDLSYFVVFRYHSD